MSAATGGLPPHPIPGLLCPKCGASAFRTYWQTHSNGTRHVRADCAKCGAFVRWLKQSPTAPDYRYEPSAVTATTSAEHPARKAPPDGWQWVGLIRQDDGRWRPVATSSTLEKCWDTLLHYPGEGDRLCVPSRPTPREDEGGRAA